MDRSVYQFSLSFFVVFVVDFVLSFLYFLLYNILRFLGGNSPKLIEVNLFPVKEDITGIMVYRDFRIAVLPEFLFVGGGQSLFDHLVQFVPFYSFFFCHLF